MLKSVDNLSSEADVPRLDRGIQRSCSMRRTIAQLKVALDPANKSRDVENINCRQTLSLRELFFQHLRREWCIQMRQKKTWLNSLVFFIILVIFFPLTLPADAHLEHFVVTGVMWFALLLANILSAERLFQIDYEEGVIEGWILSSHPMSMMILAKTFVHWGLNIFPLLIFMPIVAILFHLLPYEAWILALTLITGTPVILLLAALAAAFSTVLPQKGIVLGLILLPLSLPVLILGSAAPLASFSNLPIGGLIFALMGLSGLVMAVLPATIAVVLRNCVVS